MGRVDDGSGSKKKRKLGFKCDREKNYMERVKGKKSTTSNNANSAKKKNSGVLDEVANAGRVKSVVFDEAQRAEYLLGMHKRKNERRVEAVIQRKRKHRNEAAKMRRELREEARQQYNSAAKVPILPDYTFMYPKEEGDDGDNDDGNNHGAEEEQHYDVGASVSVSVMPLQGKQEHLRSLSKQATAAALAGKKGAGSGKYNSRTGLNPHGKVQVNERDALLMDPNLPDVVKQRLARVRKEQRGPAQPKIKVRHVAEMKKILKIRKHSRKGHGKKKSSGKRKNRGK